MIVIFQKEKGNLKKIKRFMTDENFNEQNVFNVKFPKTTLSLSYMLFVSKRNNSKINATLRGRENSLPKNIIKYCI